MSLAKKIREERKEAGLTLDELADKAGLSKTYLWELERDEDGVKRPSAEVVLRIADALSLTIADLMGLPTVKVQKESVNLPKSLIEFRDQQLTMGNKLSDKDLRELAGMSFRGGQPRTAEDWFAVYLAFARSSRKGK
ncbi:helix-turn-helix domain-containing protein [Bremerella sp.]|uniref:helix-turn-helix domain-containing protein n=1 Tax=Bremerella sp. TaxID=2795602 RepID=UPI00391BE89A